MNKQQCNFIENVDFASLHQKVERETGATSRTEYLIKLFLIEM